MLQSIAYRKIKKWAKNEEYNTNDKSVTRGKQLHGMPQWLLNNYYQEKDGKLTIDIGHFRWDWKAYSVDRDEADWIQKYFLD
jgi:hypothetical protein